MTATLIIIRFPEAQRAEDVYRALGAMRRRDLYNLEESLLAIRAASGDVVVKPLGQHADAGKQRTLEAISRLILFQASNKIDEASKRELQSAGIDVHFVTAMAASFGEEFSALFFLIRADSQADAAELSNVLSLFRGRIARTTLTPEARIYLENLQ